MCLFLSWPVSPSIYPSVSVEIAKINLNTGSNNMYDYINSKGVYLTNSAKPNLPTITTETHIKTSHPRSHQQVTDMCDLFVCLSLALSCNESYQSVPRRVFTLNTLSAIEGDHCALVLEAFFHPTWLCTDLLAWGHGDNGEVYMHLCAHRHTSQTSRSVGRSPAALGGKQSQV